MKAVLNRLRVVNKHGLNRVIKKFAGRSHFPFALVRHVGRKSGKEYETPVLAAPVQGGFMVALTYGREVDWYRNVSAAGGCVIKWRGKEYVMKELEEVERATGLPRLPWFYRPLLRMLGTREFVRMRY